MSTLTISVCLLNKDRATEHSGHIPREKILSSSVLQKLIVLVLLIGVCCQKFSRASSGKSDISSKSPTMPGISSVQSQNALSSARPFWPRYVRSICGNRQRNT